MIEYTPIESRVGGILVYFSKSIAYKPKKDLNISKIQELESTFIERINHKKSNIILGLVYSHPKLDPNEFNDKYMNKLLYIITNENKTSFLLGDFNIDLFKYDSHTSINKFLDSLSSNVVLIYILHPTRVTSHSKTLTDNIFSTYLL